MNRIVTLALIALAAAAIAPRRAAAITGTLTPADGTALVVQTTETTLDRTSDASVDLATGRELDAGYGYIADGVLHLFLAGNLFKAIQLEGFIPRWEPIDVFLDTRPGGQNQLLANNPIIEAFDADMTQMTGLRFDPGFEADWWFCLEGDFSGVTKLKAYQAELPTAGGGAGAKLGLGTCGGPGTLSGGTNPFGVEATLDDRNMAGVTEGCGAASGAGVTTGIEWSIPLAAIGNPTECIRVCAFAANNNHSQLYNQVLGPLPPGTCNLGASSAVNFGAIAGDQFFSVCPAPTPTRHSTWGALKSIYR